jgi:hypothetical protein
MKLGRRCTSGKGGGHAIARTPGNHVEHMARLRGRHPMLCDPSEAAAQRAEPMTEIAMVRARRGRAGRGELEVVSAVVVGGRRRAVVIVGVPPVRGARDHHGGDKQGERRSEPPGAAKPANHRPTLDARLESVKEHCSRASTTSWALPWPREHKCPQRVLVFLLCYDFFQCHWIPSFTVISFFQLSPRC